MSKIANTPSRRSVIVGTILIVIGIIFGLVGMCIYNHLSGYLMVSGLLISLIGAVISKRDITRYGIWP